MATMADRGDVGLSAPMQDMDIDDDDVVDSFDDSRIDDTMLSFRGVIVHLNPKEVVHECLGLSPVASYSPLLVQGNLYCSINLLLVYCDSLRKNC